MYNYNLYIFDLDGTIIDSEESHYIAYNNQLKNKLSFEKYCYIFHNINKNKFCKKNNIYNKLKEINFKNII